MRARRSDARLSAADRILERAAISTEVATTGLTEPGGETTEIDDRTGSMRQRSASMTVRSGASKLLA
jgi:hypothetical protein